ncbi:MAG: hypothetical protein JEZ03_13505 [Bacteroidales bacterium]|nr:hypothetical protein [Bacteroidales bacterium]
MKCIECGSEIVGRRPNSKYCSSQCLNKAKRNREVVKYLQSLKGLNTENGFSEQNTQNMQASGDELRNIERGHFDKISELKTQFGDKIADLKDKNLRQEFKIERLEDKIKDLIAKHSMDLTAANKSATKDVVQSITSMPAIQSTLGMIATSFISSKEKGLSGVESGFNIQERQIIEAIRRMQPDAQSYLVQMLYVLFAKSNVEQMEIFTSLQAYMMNPEEEVDV